MDILNYFWLFFTIVNYFILATCNYYKLLLIILSYFILDY
jgi:hypothetical protein